MQFLTRLAARFFAPKETVREDFTLSSALEILSAYDPKMKGKDYNRLCAAAQFLYKEKKLPQHFLALPYHVQANIVMGEVLQQARASGISNFNPYIPNNGVRPPPPVAPPPKPQFKR